MAWSAHTLVQGMDADLACAYAQAGSPFSRTWLRGFSYFPVRCRRQRVGGDGPSGVFVWSGLGTHPAALNGRSPGRRRSPGTLYGRCSVRLLRIGLFRRPRPLAARHVEQDACIDPDARALVAAFTCGLVGRAGAHEEALFLEKDRTRGRQSVAAREQNSCPPRTRALPRRAKASRSTCPDSDNLEITPQIGGGILRPPFEAKWRDKTALLVHEIDQRGVIHTVIAIFGGNFLGIDAIGFFCRVDCRTIARCTAQMRVEARQIVFHHRGCISFRINGYEQRPGAVRILAERAQDLGDVEQRRGTHVGTMRVAEENKEWSALNICLGNLRTVLVDQLERSTDR